MIEESEKGIGGFIIEWQAERSAAGAIRPASTNLVWSPFRVAGWL